MPAVGVHNYRSPKCLSSSRWKCNCRFNVVCCKGIDTARDVEWDECNLESTGMLHGHPATMVFVD